MKEIRIQENEAGQRLDKFLKKYMKEAPFSFFYKMLRKKNIVLNGKKATGKEILKLGDSVKLFLSEDTIKKFAGEVKMQTTGSIPSLEIVYEDRQVLLLNKPAGVLSQQAKKGDISMVEALNAYLLESGQITTKELRTFHPSVCNRLDRNTSGLMAAGKTFPALQQLGKVFRERSIEKWYLCIVKGCIEKKGQVEGFLLKDKKTNMVSVGIGGDTQIRTEYIPVAWNQEMTLLKVHLITGKTHQIRAHLSSINHPILGDPKYGDARWNETFGKKNRIRFQLLHAYSLTFPEMEAPLAYLSLQTYYAKVPNRFWKMIEETKWQHGIQEALEVLH